MYGTLLGLYRDKKIIEGSGDIDLGIMAEDLIKIRDFGGVVTSFGGRPVYFNYQGNPIINVQAWHQLGNKRYYLDTTGLIQQELPNNKIKIEKLLEEWYGNWETPQKGVHAQTKIFKITFDHYDNPISTNSST